MTTQYRLGSAEFVHAPGLVAWAINGAKFKKDRKAVASVVAQTWSIPPSAAMALVTWQGALHGRRRNRRVLGIGAPAN